MSTQSRSLATKVHSPTTGDRLTWAGYSPWTRQTCFGSDRGKCILPSIVEGRVRVDSPFKRVSDPVNGVSFMGEYALVTSRTEILAVRRHSESAGRYRYAGAKIDFGSHGSVVLRSCGVFIAPLGMSGLARIEPDGKRVQVSLFNSGGREVNYFGLARVGSYKGDELLVAACRTDGIGTLRLAKDTSVEALHFRVFPDADIVAVVPVGDPRLPWAVIGVGEDGQIYYVPDVTTDGPAFVAKSMATLGAISGFVIRGGHGFALTDDYLYCLTNLVNDLISFNEQPTATYFFRVDAADIFPTGDNRFALLEQTQMREFEVDSLVTALTARDDIPFTRTRVKRDGIGRHENIVDTVTRSEFGLLGQRGSVGQGFKLRGEKMEAVAIG